MLLDITQIDIELPVGLEPHEPRATLVLTTVTGASREIGVEKQRKHAGEAGGVVYGFHGKTVIAVDMRERGGRLAGDHHHATRRARVAGRGLTLCRVPAGSIIYYHIWRVFLK